MISLNLPVNPTVTLFKTKTPISLSLRWTSHLMPRLRNRYFRRRATSVAGSLEIQEKTWLITPRIGYGMYPTVAPYLSSTSSIEGYLTFRALNGATHRYSCITDQ